LISLTLRTKLSQEWLSKFFLGEQIQSGQRSLSSILSADAFRKI